MLGLSEECLRQATKISQAPVPRTPGGAASLVVASDRTPGSRRRRSTHHELLSPPTAVQSECAGEASRCGTQAGERLCPVSRASVPTHDNGRSFKVSWTCLDGDYLGVKTHATRWRALTTPRKRQGVRLGPRYPRHTLVLEIAPPRIAPMSDQQFARAVEILAEMLAHRQHEGDSPSNRVVIRRVRV